MSYFSQQISNGRYGIFIDNELAAFISCPEACKKLVEGLKARLPKHSKVEAIEENDAVMSFKDSKVAS